MSTELPVGTFVDLSHIGKQPAEVLKKNNPRQTAKDFYNYTFRLVEGRVVSYRRIPVAFA